VPGSGSADVTTILVVDDEPALSMLACDFLRDAGFRALEAHSAQQAIELFERGEQVDLVFSDVQMPGMDGFELQRWIRQHRPRTRILLCSGVEAVKAAGGYLGPPRWLIYKPYDMAELERRIRSLIGESAHPKA
jgi:DNA-binding response OmpR family regulator